MLSGVRVLELSLPQTMFAGQILADLGADVIAVEPPGGSLGRRMEPFRDDRIGLERSLTWHALNRNKRGITIDVECHDGRDTFERLAASATVVLEAAPARFHHLADRGLVHCEVRPFSASGPKSRYAFTDRTIVASTGAPSYTGEGDRAPLFIPVPQAMMETGGEAAIGVLAALLARDRDDQGQSVEVSMRVAAMMSAFSLPYFSATPEPRPTRPAGRRLVLGVEIPAFYRCRDGFVQVSVAFGGFGGITKRMVDWLVRDHGLDAAISGVDWSRFPSDADQRKDVQRLQALIGALQQVIGSLSKSEVGLAARAHGFFAAPLMDMSDIAAFGQYAERGLWARQVIDAELSIDAPVNFAHFSSCPIEQRLPAPGLSEHTTEVLAEAGFSSQEIRALFAHQVI